MANYILNPTKEDLLQLNTDIRKELSDAQYELALMKLRHQQNPLDTALAASLKGRLDSLCQCAIRRRGVKQLAITMMGWGENE